MNSSEDLCVITRAIVLEKLKIEIDKISRRKCICANDFLKLNNIQDLISYYSTSLNLAKYKIDIYHSLLIEYCHDINYLLGPSYTHMCATQYLKPLGYTSQKIDAFINYHILKYQLRNAKD
jgi:hypothetical protein